MRLLSLLLLALLCGAFAANDAVAQLLPADQERENLGPNINSRHVEILPIISPDGKTLYFDRKYDSSNVGGVGDDDDIYYSTLLKDGTWSPARNVGPPLNTPGSDVLYWISTDGNTALVYNGEKINGQDLGLAISHRVKGVWQKPARVTIEGVTDLGDRGYYAYISPDGRRLMVAFARDRQEPENADIFYCPALGTDLLHWGAPVNLGSVINTPAFDGAPFIAADNRTMYFASNGRSGYGDADLYVSHRIGDGWLQWTEPIDLGPTVNTPLSEASLSISAQGDYAYVSGAGNIGEIFYGAADIYRIKLPDTMRPQPTMTIEGKLVAGSTGVQGLIRAERLPDRKEIASAASDQEGRFTMMLPTGGQYRLTGGSEGYAEASKNIDIRKPKSLQMEVTLKLTGPARARVVPTSPGRPADTASSMFALPPSDPVHFAFGSAKLDEEAKDALSRALVGFKAAVAAGRSIEINVTGHTDDVGSAQANRTISLARANSVKRWLIGQGIDPGSITVRGRGKSQPVAPNDSRDGRAQNRRVEIQIDGVLTVPNAVVTPKK